jgi:hypothetical protein
LSTPGPTVATPVAAQGPSGHELEQMFVPPSQEGTSSLRLRPSPRCCDCGGHARRFRGSSLRSARTHWCRCGRPRLQTGDRRHLLPGHLLHCRTVAGAGVPRCARTGTGDRCGRAALCAHGGDMPLTCLRVLRQMPHPVPAVWAVLMRGAAVRAPLGHPLCGRSGRELVGSGASRLHAPLFVACGCPYSGTGIANSPCSWCAVLVEVSGPRSHRRRLQTDSSRRRQTADRQQLTRQLEVCHTELALQNKPAVYNAIRTRPGKRTPTMCFPGKGSTRGRQKSWQPGDRTTCVLCNRTIFIHVATLGA